MLYNVTNSAAEMFLAKKTFPDSVETLTQQRAEGCSTLHKIVTIFGYKRHHYRQESKQSSDITTFLAVTIIKLSRPCTLPRKSHMLTHIHTLLFLEFKYYM